MIYMFGFEIDITVLQYRIINEIVYDNNNNFLAN